MATVTMELDELDLLKKNAKEVEQDLRNKIEALQNQNTTLTNNSRKVLVKRETTYKKYLIPLEHFHRDKHNVYEISALRNAIDNNEPIWIMGEKYKYDEKLKVFVSNKQQENSTESIEFIGFEEVKEKLKSKVIDELKEALEEEKENSEALKQELKNQKKNREMIISKKMESFKEEVNNAYKEELETKDNTIKELEEKLKKEQENFVQYKAKIEQDEQNMSQKDLIEKLRKEISKLKEQLQVANSKKSWLGKLFSSKMED